MKPCLSEIVRFRQEKMIFTSHNPLDGKKEGESVTRVYQHGHKYIPQVYDKNSGMWLGISGKGQTYSLPCMQERHCSCPDHDWAEKVIYNFLKRDV